MLVRFVALICAVVVIGQSPAVAQTGSVAATGSASVIEGGAPSYIRAETPAQRKARLGTSEDPGVDPDPKARWFRFGHQYHIEKYKREFASYEGTALGWVRPMAQVNFEFEIYQQNETYVWVWMPTLEELQAVGSPNDDAPAAAVSKYTPPQIAYLKKIAPDFYPLEPAAAPKTVRFQNSSQGLPTVGSYRNSGAIADMNGDGHADIIVPPTRGPAGAPNIFLGDGKGGWTLWNTSWPYPMQYGNVVAADFNRDKKMDLAFGVHLTGVRVFLGDNKGSFEEANQGLEIQFPSRRVTVADVNADGLPDLLALYEGPSPGLTLEGSRVKTFINVDGAKRWELREALTRDEYVAGDWFATGNFNGDKYPDFVTANTYFQRPETLYQSNGPATWSMVDHRDGELVPYLSTYSAVGVGRFGSKLDDALMAYQRSWPSDVDPSVVSTPPIRSVVGIDRISFAGKQPKRVPVMRFEGANPISGLAAADFDRDGKTDILFTRGQPREAVLLLGDGRGSFKRATLTGLDLASNPNYDINVADVNADGRPDVVVLYESTAEGAFATQNGIVQVFLNRATTATNTASAAKGGATE